jgi:hypothetical protein
MIEPTMYFGLGFLTASLLTLLVIPSVHNRALQLAKRRLKAVMPLSMAEVRAERDQLRAEYAMSTCRLETRVKQLKAKVTELRAELGHKTYAINRLKLGLADRPAAISPLGAQQGGSWGGSSAPRSSVPGSPQTHASARPSPMAILLRSGRGALLQSRPTVASAIPDRILLRQSRTKSF